VLTFGASFVVLNYEKDFYTMTKQKRCAGVLITLNTFSKNIGCPNAFGNVIVSCEPRFIDI
jgi:hypothetical protein